MRDSSNPAIDSILKTSRDPRRSIWLECVLDASGKGLLEAMNRASTVTAIFSGFTFKLDAGCFVTEHGGIIYEYEHEIVAMEHLKCQNCHRALELLDIDRWSPPVWGRAGCKKCRKYYPVVAEDP